VWVVADARILIAETQVFDQFRFRRNQVKFPD
jgi:hypothetical protein